MNQSVIVTQVTSYDFYDKYTVFDGLNSYHFSSREGFSVGDVLHIKGYIELYQKQTIPGGFNSFEYWLGKGIKGLIRVEHVSVRNLSVLRHINFKEVYIFNLFKDETLIETQWMNHLFKLSSIHLTFLIALVMKLLYYLDIENVTKYLIVSTCMLIIYFVGYSVIVLRMCIKYGIQFINAKFKFEIDSFNIECITFVLIILLKPFIVYNQSFLVIYVLIFFMQLRIQSTQLLTWLSIPMLIAPFLLHWHKDISLISLMVIPIFGILLKYVWVPSLLVASALPFMNIMGWITNIILRIENFLSIYDYRLYFVHLKGIMWISYFVVIIYVFAAPHKKAFYKRLTIYLVLCLISFLYTFKTPDDSVIFLDVGQGDSAVIFKDGKVIVVDAFNSVTSYLKYNYVYEIDYLILTHADLDHVKEVDDLLKTFNVKHVILSQYNHYNIQHPNIFYAGAYHLDFLNEVGIELLGPIKDFNNINENSVIFKIMVGNYTYLFTGDIGVRAEKHYVETYGHKLQSDVLKVPHHGSNTSSSTLLLNYVRPSIAIVSVSARNIYNLPNKEVIDAYLKLGVYLHQTKNSGSLKIKNGKIKTFPP